MKMRVMKRMRKMNEGLWICLFDHKPKTFSSFLINKKSNKTQKQNKEQRRHREKNNKMEAMTTQSKERYILSVLVTLSVIFDGVLFGYFFMRHVLLSVFVAAFSIGTYSLAVSGLHFRKRQHFLIYLGLKVFQAVVCLIEMGVAIGICLYMFNGGSLEGVVPFPHPDSDQHEHIDQLILILYLYTEVYFILTKGLYLFALTIPIIVFGRQVFRALPFWNPTPSFFPLR